jgi:hypothetical protein
MNKTSRPIHDANRGWITGHPESVKDGARMGLIWLGEERVQGDPRGPGGPPYEQRRRAPFATCAHFTVCPKRPAASGHVAAQRAVRCLPVARRALHNMLEPAAAGAMCYLASVDGEARAGAALTVRDGLATLCADGVIARFRRLGLQRELIAARLNEA